MHTAITSLARPAWSEFLGDSGMIEFAPVEPESAEITAARNEVSDAFKKVLHARHVAYVAATEAHWEAMEAIRAQEVFPCDLSELDTDTLSLAELESAMLDASYGDEFEFFADAWTERLELAAMDSEY